MSLVSNVPLRKAFEESGLMASEVCFRLGWTRTYEHGVRAETSRLMRALGLMTSRKDGYESVYVRVGLVKAEKIAVALGVDFDELYEDLPVGSVADGGACRCCAADLLREVDDGLCGFCREEINLGLVAA